MSRKLSVLLWACASMLHCGDLDAVDHVHDLRLLGMQAEPCDQPFSPSTAAEAPAASTTAPVTLTALIADPAGAGRPLHYVLAVCTALDTDDQRCLRDAPGYQVLAEGDTRALGGYTELALPALPADGLLLQALAADAYRGLDGVWLPLQLTVSADAESVTGTKLLVYTLPALHTDNAINTNPVMAGLQVDGQTWDANTPVTLSRQTMPKDGWSIAPVFDSNLQVAYPQPTFSGTQITLQESWQFDFFSTTGGFSRASSGGTRPLIATDRGLSTLYQPPPAAASGPVLFWVVVRDGRGGENWLVRRAELTP